MDDGSEKDNGLIYKEDINHPIVPPRRKGQHVQEDISNQAVKKVRPVSIIRGIAPIKPKRTSLIMNEETKNNDLLVQTPDSRPTRPPPPAIFKLGESFSAKRDITDGITIVAAVAKEKTKPPVPSRPVFLQEISHIKSSKKPYIDSKCVPCHKDNLRNENEGSKEKDKNINTDIKTTPRKPKPRPRPHSKPPSAPPKVPPRKAFSFNSDNDMLRGDKSNLSETDNLAKVAENCKLESSCLMLNDDAGNVASTVEDSAVCKANNYDGNNFRKISEGLTGITCNQEIQEISTYSRNSKMISENNNNNLDSPAIDHSKRKSLLCSENDKSIEMNCVDGGDKRQKSNINILKSNENASCSKTLCLNKIHICTSSLGKEDTSSADVKSVEYKGIPEKHASKLSTHYTDNLCNLVNKIEYGNIHFKDNFDNECSKIEIADSEVNYKLTTEISSILDDLINKVIENGSFANNSNLSDSSKRIIRHALSEHFSEDEIGRSSENVDRPILSKSSDTVDRNIIQNKSIKTSEVKCYSAVSIIDESAIETYDNVKLKFQPKEEGCFITSSTCIDSHRKNLNQDINKHGLKIKHSYENVSRSDSNIFEMDYSCNINQINSNPERSKTYDFKKMNKNIIYNSCDNIYFNVSRSQRKSFEDLSYLSNAKPMYTFEGASDDNIYDVPASKTLMNNVGNVYDVPPSSTLPDNIEKAHEMPSCKVLGDDIGNVYQVPPCKTEVDIIGSASEESPSKIMQGEIENGCLAQPCKMINDNVESVYQVALCKMLDDDIGSTYDVPPCKNFPKIHDGIGGPLQQNVSSVSSDGCLDSSTASSIGHHFLPNLGIIESSQCVVDVESMRNKGPSSTPTLPTTSARKQRRTYEKGKQHINLSESNQDMTDDEYVEVEFSYRPETEEKVVEGWNLQEPAGNIEEKAEVATDDFTENQSLKEQFSLRSSKVISCESYSEHIGKYNYYESDSEEEEEIVEQENKKQKSKYYYIAYEILTTEKSFVEALKMVVEDFGGALKAAMERNPKLLPDGAYSTMFMNIEQIYQLDKKFLQELEERMQHWDQHQRIGDLIREYGHFLKMYTVYIKGYDNAMITFHDCHSTNMKFFQIVEKFEKSPNAKMMKLTSFMLKPIQRIPSYRLLLKDYLKNLPPDHLDYKDISDGVGIVSEVASYINESMKEGEKFQEVLHIQSQIMNSNDIVKPGRYLLKEGSLQKLSRKELQQRFFILFTDALLYCSQMPHGQLKLINELPLAGMIVQIPDSQDLTNEFIVSSTKRSFLLNANSSKERENWVEALKSAVKIVNKNRRTFLLDKGEKTSSQKTADIGDIAPPWIPDSRVTMCQICTDDFTIYNRRHHCRACGKVVCNDCSAFEAPLRYMDNEAARVCSNCYDYLKGKYTQISDLKTNEDLRAFAKFRETKTRRRKGRGKSLSSVLTEVGAQEEGIENSGFLKLRKGGKKEKRWWFVLKDLVLYSYKASSDPAAISTTPVLGYKVQVDGNWDEEDFTFTLSHKSFKEPMIFRAESRVAAERWVHCLLKATEFGS